MALVSEDTSSMATRLANPLRQDSNASIAGWASSAVPPFSPVDSMSTYCSSSPLRFSTMVGLLGGISSTTTMALAPAWGRR